MKKNKWKPKHGFLKVLDKSKGLENFIKMLLNYMAE